MERKLPESMYLIVKRNREDQPWQFPQGRLLDSESSLRAVSTPARTYFTLNNHDCFSILFEIIIKLNLNNLFAFN